MSLGFSKILLKYFLHLNLRQPSCHFLGLIPLSLLTSSFLLSFLLLSQAPALLLPLGQSSDGAHLPNERIKLENLLRGKSVLTSLFERIARKLKEQAMK